MSAAFMHQRPFDPQLSVTRELVMTEPGKGKTGKSGELETGLAWMLWLLGFSVVHFGTTSKMSDAVDIVAVTPNGHYAMIECTTGHLKSDHKLSSLVARTARVKAELEKNGIRNVKIISVMVTNRPREEIRADLEQADKLGVLVVSRETLDRVFAVQSKLHPDADKYYREAEEYLSTRAQSTSA
jgi:Holliday junction resolvase